MLPIMRKFTTKQHQKQESNKESDKPEKPFDYTSMDFYQILEVNPTANEVELKKSFLKLAKKYHPDVYKGE